MWKLLNILFVVGGGLAISPLFLQGLGTAEAPPSLSFVLIVAAFSFFSGICLAYHDVVLCGNEWVAPSISISPFGKGKKLQSLYLCSWSFITTGVGCALFAGRLGRIEWMGAVPLLIGVGLLAAAVMARRIFLKQ